MMNSTVYKEAMDLWMQQNEAGLCPRAGATKTDWLQGYPVSQFAKLARQANLLYTAVMDCTAVECSRKMGDVWDRGWCSSDVKKKRFADVDVFEKLLPTIWSVFDGYLR